MKLVTYSSEEYYFLTDDEFDLAAESWGNGKPVYFKARGIYLPIPRRPAGMPTEHTGLQLAFTFSKAHYGMPGWIGIKAPVRDGEGNEEIRGALYVRALDHGSARVRYRWHWLYPERSSEEIREIISEINPIKAEDILKDTILRDLIPFEPLLTEYYLN